MREYIFIVNILLYKKTNTVAGETDATMDTGEYCKRNTNVNKSQLLMPHALFVPDLCSVSMSLRTYQLQVWKIIRTMP